MLVWIFIGLAVLCVFIVVMSMKTGFIPTQKNVTNQALSASSKLRKGIGKDHLGEAIGSIEYGKVSSISVTYDYSMENIVSAWRSGKAPNIIVVLGMIGGFWGIALFLACALFAVGSLPFTLTGVMLISMVVYGSRPFIEGFIEENRRQSEGDSNA
ncbi:hypothetical protein EXA23_16370 [Vibrio cincinnatiensis]|uniref:hypothetical protein n=1 Tax=Vibrio cincinnatiensis TaxID=675 RepID=UPI001EDF6A25|nr:hypothetical protein [Vibrio cincinnatiensis]MCG3731089.1 hypothetical protein [Vibrio cincinnatiensis]MCG3767733.1 hypothetical protein [Vibrio cincinnatiensis]